MATQPDDQRYDNIMRKKPLPVEYRKYLLDISQYMIKLMPDNAQAQREIINQQDPDPHFDDGRKCHFGSAKFYETFRPEIGSMPESLTCSVRTTHDLRQTVEQTEKKQPAITLEIRVPRKFTGHRDTAEKGIHELAGRIDQLLYLVAEKAGLKKAPKNLVPEGGFQVSGYTQGTDVVRALYISSPDKGKLQQAMSAMAKELETEHQQEKRDNVIDRILRGDERSFPDKQR